VVGAQGQSGDRLPPQHPHALGRGRREVGARVGWGTRSVGAHDVDASAGAVVEVCQGIGEGDVVQLHPALQRLRRAKGDARRRRKQRTTGE
jgi:hypothetical protein